MTWTHVLQAHNELHDIYGRSSVGRQVTPREVAVESTLAKSWGKCHSRNPEAFGLAAACKFLCEVDIRQLGLEVSLQKGRSGQVKLACRRSTSAFSLFQVEKKPILGSFSTEPAENLPRLTSSQATMVEPINLKYLKGSADGWVTACSK